MQPIEINVYDIVGLPLPVCLLFSLFCIFYNRLGLLFLVRNEEEKNTEFMHVHVRGATIGIGIGIRPASE